MLISWVLLSVLPLATGQGGFTLNAPPAVAQCGTYTISWEGGQGVHRVFMEIAGGLQEITENPTMETSVSWHVNAPAGFAVAVRVVDSRGLIRGHSRTYTVANGPSTCLTDPVPGQRTSVTLTRTTLPPATQTTTSRTSANLTSTSDTTTNPVSDPPVSSSSSTTVELTSPPTRTVTYTSTATPVTSESSVTETSVQESRSSSGPVSESTTATRPALPEETSQTVVQGKTITVVREPPASTSPTKKAETESGGASLNLGAIIGGAVGGAVGLALLVALVLWRWTRSRREATFPFEIDNMGAVPPEPGPVQMLSPYTSGSFTTGSFNSATASGSGAYDLAAGAGAPRASTEVAASQGFATDAGPVTLHRPPSYNTEWLDERPRRL